MVLYAIHPPVAANNNRQTSAMGRRAAVKAQAWPRASALPNRVCFPRGQKSTARDRKQPAKQQPVEREPVPRGAEGRIAEEVGVSDVGRMPNRTK